jgi:transcription elongation factor Elf1
MNQPGTRKGFALQCPYCGAEESIRLDADSLSAFICCECDADFGAEDVRRLIGRWQRLLDWLDTAPDYPGD